MVTPKRILCLDKALDILEHVGEATELGSSQLATRLGLHVATVHNIVKTLALRNYLVNVRGRYRLGPACCHLAASWEPTVVLPQIAAEHIERMSAKTGEAGCIAIAVGRKVELIQVSQGREEVAVQFPGRTCDHPMQLATGRLLVALGPEDLWGEFIARHMAGEEMSADERLRGAEEWREELRKIRTEGCFLKVRPGEGATSSVAAPVLGSRGSLLAAVGGSCPTFRATGQHMRLMLDAAIDAGRALSAELGGAPPEAQGQTRQSPQESGACPDGKRSRRTARGR